MNTTTQKSFQPSNKDVRYLNRDFSQFKTGLINFAKTYFPNSYTDFSPSSPGMMFIEMASYVGDVLSFYTDYIFKEGIIQNATERKNIVNLAKFLGYKVKPSTASTVDVDVYQIIPATQDSTGEYVPDNTYALSIRENMQVVNGSNSYFITNEPINFAVNTILSPMDVSVYSRDAAGIPQFFLLKKSVRASAGQIITKTFVITDPTPFLDITLDETNVLDIMNVVDSDNNTWYAVDSLAQELILTSVPNDQSFEGPLSISKTETPYIVKYLRTSRRFTINVDDNNKTYLEFGPGLEGFADEIVNLNSQTVGIGLSNISKLNVPYDPSNFLKNETYGIAPSNTTLTITYLVGGGIASNCPSNDIRSVISVDYDNTFDGMTPDQINLFGVVKNSLKVNNPNPATGGKDSESDDEIKQNAISYFATQNRAVTKDDYLVRIFSIPSKYGSIAKACVATNTSLNVNINKILTGTVDTNNNTVVNNNDVNTYFRKIAYDISNPFAINIYVLSYDANKNLTQCNDALVANLINYLKGYRMMTDGVNIIDGYIINIGVNFSIVVYKGYNKADVLNNCISAVQNFFNIDSWTFSQPINLSQLELEIAKIEGVQSVMSLEIVNLTTNDGPGYSQVEYDIKSATKNKVIFPPVDPAVFSVKFPDRDIHASSA